MHLFLDVGNLHCESSEFPSGEPTQYLRCVCLHLLTFPGWKQSLVESSIVHVTRTELMELQKKVSDTASLQSIIQEKDAQLREKCDLIQRFGQHLIAAHKAIEKFRLEHAAKGVTSDKSTNTSVTESFSLNADIVVDGDPAIFQTFRHKMYEKQDLSSKQESVKKSMPSETQKTPGLFHSMRNSNSRVPSLPSCSMTSLELRNKEQRMADLWSVNNGVPKNLYLAALRELKKTKQCLKEALDRQLEVNGNMDSVVIHSVQRETIKDLEQTIETQKREIDDLKQKIENLQPYKKIVKNDIEGVTVHPPSLSSQNSGEYNNYSRENSLTKDESDWCRKEKQLQDEMNNLKVKIEILEKEKHEAVENYRSLQKSKEEEKYSSVQRMDELTKENASFRHELSSSEEDKKFLYSSIEQLNNKLTKKEQIISNEKHLHQMTKEKHVEDMRVTKNAIDQLNSKVKSLEIELQKEHKSKVKIQEDFNRQSKTLERVIHEKTKLEQELALTNCQIENKQGQKKVPEVEPYTCQRCLQEFSVENEFLIHLSKCID